MANRSNSMKFLPYHMDGHVWSREFCKVSFYAFVPDVSLELDGRFANGTPSDLVEFLKTHGRCAFCKSSIGKDFGKCHCGKPRGKRNHLVIEYPTERYVDFGKIFDREIARVRASKRAAMIRENGGSFDKKHIKGMHAAQRGLCYYCGSPIQLGSRHLHFDHYMPISMGGRNDLDNMVLACSPCNFRKNAMDGPNFDAKVRRLRSPEFSTILREIRKDLKAYKKANGMEATLKA